MIEGPYDVSLVEGSITTPDDADRILAVRAASRLLVTIGACATAGGIQALRNYADVGEYTSTVYAHPEYISTLADVARPISSYVQVDFELQRLPDQPPPAPRGRHRLLAGRRPVIPGYSVCEECKRPATLRPRRPRDAVPRPGDPRRLRRPLPGGRPRLLRLLRAGGHDEHRSLSSGSPSSALADRGVSRMFRTFNCRRDRVPKESLEHDA